MVERKACLAVCELLHFVPMESSGSSSREAPKELIAIIQLAYDQSMSNIGKIPLSSRKYHRWCTGLSC